MRIEDEYLLDDYKDGVVFIRKEFLPIIIKDGKKEQTSFVTIPVFRNEDTNKEYKDWFYREFRDIVAEICKKKEINLPENQQNPSYKEDNIGWYLPYSIIFEIMKMWQEEGVPYIQGLLRPYFRVYGTSPLEKYVREIMANFLEEAGFVDVEKVNEVPEKEPNQQIS